jgi:hypothetical protein
MPERELTYFDPDAETITDADDGEPTAADAARLLLDQFERSGGRLRTSEATERFAEEFGGRFLDGSPGRWRISGPVLDRFARLAPDAFWGEGDRSWRWRYSWDRD